MEIKFIVRGEPRPKGSKNAFVVNWPHGKDKNKVVKRIKGIAAGLLKNPFGWRPQTTVSEVSKQLKPWEKNVSNEALKAMAPYDGPLNETVPVRLIMEFFVKRPNSHYGTGKNADIIKNKYKDALPLRTPDLSKLFRAAEDGLTGIVFHDDCQVVEMVAKKRYGRKNGVRITAVAVDHDTVAKGEPEQLLLFKVEDL